MIVQWLMRSLRSYEQILLRCIENSFESTFQYKLSKSSQKKEPGNIGEQSRCDKRRGRNSCERGGYYSGKRENNGGSNKWCRICKKNN